MATEHEVAAALERCNAAVVAILEHVTNRPPWQATTDSLARMESIERTYHTPEWEVREHVRIRNGKVQRVKAFTSHRKAIVT